MAKPALDYYLHDSSSAFRLELRGHLCGETAQSVALAWQTASSIFGTRERVVDMTSITACDDDGGALLLRWHRDGVRLVANTKVSRELAESALGQRLPEPARQERFGLLRLWRSTHRPVLRHAVKIFAALLGACFTPWLQGATLKPETDAAWQEYLRGVEQDQQVRLTTTGKFLRVFEDPKRVAAVQHGQIVVVPAPGPNPRRVEGGLIHHWVGAMFLPGRKIDDVTNVTSDYDRYVDVYKPYVVRAKTLARNGANDRMTMRIVNKALVLKFALDADYAMEVHRVDESHYYGVTRTTRVQEVEKFESPEEHSTPEGQGYGYIWKMYAICRMEQRDGGVYVEMEALALSRDIPAAFRFAVDPIVRRTARNSLLVSLEQTRAAVQRRAGEHITLRTDKRRSGAF
jgi:hypothetical protein